MGIIFENTSANYRKLFLVIALLVALSEVATAQRKIDCRKFVFAPPCRGIAAKRDTHSHPSDIRITPADDSDYIIDGQKVVSNDNYATVNELLRFLKKAMSKNLEYDSSSNDLA
ncbi:abdominal ganglion neuropeptide L11-like [Anoplophora glabripennis]|uniref:abdominal ganglion neuropeptide L11-like n=1 Tax=Anoplophora glabripennis TaxID=217634 RepID=UPI000875673E|nr:abdominal ganglion neuropeptide L11-like [Anoplophora glabripennis]